MAGLNNRIKSLFPRAILGNGNNMGSRDHYLSGHGLLQIEYALDHVPFIMVDESLLFTFVKDVLDFFRTPFQAYLF